MDQNVIPLIGDREDGFSSLLEEYIESDDRHLNHCQVLNYEIY